MKAVLVTGANSGIGLYITKRLHTEFHIFACSRKEKGFEAFEGLDNITPVILDVTDQSTIEAAVKLVRKSDHQLYGLVNNAGTAIIFPASLTPVKYMQDIFDVNIFGVNRMVYSFLDLLIESKGRIVNISSISGILTSPGMSVYSTSKHALEAYSDGLNMELKEVGVSISLIEPGNYNSNMGNNTVPVIEELLTNIPEEKRPARIVQMIERRKNREADQEEEVQEPEPISVAEEVYKALTVSKPKLRYLIADVETEANITLKGAMIDFLQLNYDHKFSLSQDQVHALIDEFYTEEPTDLLFNMYKRWRERL